MEIKLSHKPRKATFILGFPGVGLVGPIVTEFLIEHMRTTQIGVFEYDELPPTTAVHKGKLIHPMSLHYSKEHNTVIFYTILNAMGNEWKIAREVADVAQALDAREIICIDGANVMGAKETQLYSYGNDALAQLGAHKLEESVITGVSGALLLNVPRVSCIFASAGAMPGSKGAADVVKLLDKYLGLEVDPGPLLQQATRFEQKLKGLAEQSQRIQAEKERRSMDYLG